jgi:hypothetical protein
MTEQPKPVPMTRPGLAAKLCAWARSLTPEEKAAVRNRLLAGVKS